MEKCAFRNRSESYSGCVSAASAVSDASVCLTCVLFTSVILFEIIMIGARNHREGAMVAVMVMVMMMAVWMLAMTTRLRGGCLALNLIDISSNKLNCNANANTKLFSRIKSTFDCCLIDYNDGARESYC